jgi:hypothetical protein
MIAPPRHDALKAELTCMGENVGAVALHVLDEQIEGVEKGRAVGLKRARREGKRLGRPPIAPELRERIQEALRAPGRPGVRKIATQFGVNASTVQQISSGL